MGFKLKAGKNHYDIRNQRLQLPIISWISAQKRGDSWWPSLVRHDLCEHCTHHQCLLSDKRIRIVFSWRKFDRIQFANAFLWAWWTSMRKNLTIILYEKYSRSSFSILWILVGDIFSSFEIETLLFPFIGFSLCHWWMLFEPEPESNRQKSVRFDFILKVKLNRTELEPYLII